MTQTKEIKGFVIVVGEYVQHNTFSDDQQLCEMRWVKELGSLGFDLPEFKTIPATLTVEQNDE